MKVKALFGSCFLGHSLWKGHSFFFFLIYGLFCLEFCLIWILNRRFYMSRNEHKLKVLCDVFLDFILGY